MTVELTEINRIERLTKILGDRVKTVELDRITCRDTDLPIYGLVIGNSDRSLPTLGLIGGVHGLERVGCHVILAYLESLAARLTWDKEVRHALTKMRIASIPVLNPWGLATHRRCNPNGVDLMRNAPVEATAATPIAGGQRFARWLPWYRGSSEMERESTALLSFVEQEIFPSRAALVLDVHSGYGFRDRLWYPYAKSTEPFAGLGHVLALGDLLSRTYPYHVYRIEPQSANYTAHGDLWDHLYDKHCALPDAKQRVFVPWTLELGSWKWVRKNPLQLLSADGVFNPIAPHRYSRTMRRHLTLLDFFFRATRSYDEWLPAVDALPLRT